MVERVVETIASMKEISQIAIVIEDPELLKGLPGLEPYFANGSLETIVAKPSPAQSALYGFEMLGSARESPILMTTADNCLLTADILTHFLEALKEGVDVTAAVARTDMVTVAYPDARRTRLRFRDGSKSGCNLFAFQTTDAQRVIGFWRMIEENRKSPLTMLRRLGVITVLSYLTNTLTLAQAVNKLGKRTGTTLATVDIPFPEAAIDVDTPEDFYLVERILSDRESGSG